MSEERPLLADSLEVREVDALPTFDQISHGEIFALSLSTNTTPLTHGIHRFPAKFIPQIPAWALDNFGSRESVTLDPFCGSGTTLVEGLLRGGVNIGLDIDPLARMITRAKTTSASADTLEALSGEIQARWTAPAPQLRTSMTGVKNFEHWFQTPQWGWVQSLFEIIPEMKCSDDERLFLMTVFSSILRRVSNADDQSQKTYVSGTLPKSPPDVRETFFRSMKRAVGGQSDLTLKRNSHASISVPADGDGTNIQLASDSVDLAVTSPPYLDSVDYMYNMMIEYFWLGPLLGVEDRLTFNRLRRESVGAKSPLNQTPLPEYLEDLIRLDDLPTARRTAASEYFALMASHFREISRVLKPGMRYVFVVGNSQSRSNVIPMHDALVRQAAAEGLSLEKAFGYRIRRHYMKFPRAGRGGIILVDWVLVLKKTGEKHVGSPLPLPWVTLDRDAVAH